MAVRSSFAAAAFWLLASWACAGDLSAHARSLAMERASGAVLGLHASAVDGASTAATLGSERSGSGVLIGADGLVLTAGWLVIEADEVDLVTDDERHIPARVVAADPASGFGLVQALAPVGRKPAPIGRAAALSRDEPLAIASGGPDAEVGPARLVGRRDYAAGWEFAAHDALFTLPPRPDYGGAALFNLRGELVGIGELTVDDALGADAGHHPGTLFLSVDALAPILAELRRDGRSRASLRPWIGLYCDENGGGLRVLGVAADSPADVAGVQAGDRVRRIDGAAVAHLSELWARLWAGAGPERAVRLEVERDGRSLAITVHSIARETMLRHAGGI